MIDIKEVIGKINGYKQIGTHNNNDYIFFDEIMEDLTNISIPVEQQVREKFAEEYIIKIDEYTALTGDIELPCEITFGGSLKIYVEDGYKITKAMNGYGDRADEFIGREIEIFQKIDSKFSA